MPHPDPLQSPAWRRLRVAAVAVPLVGLLLTGTTRATAQVNSIQVGLAVSAPTPYLAQWATTHSVAMLMVTNTSGVDVYATVTAEFWKDDMQVGTAPGLISVIPGATRDSVPEVVVTNYPAPAIAEWGAAQLEGDVGRSYARTGRLPEGEYSLCVRFDDVTPAEPTSRTVEDTQQCAFFRIGNPQPPTLLLPADGSDVRNRNPVFTWTPVVATGVTQVLYHLRVVEVLPGQTPTRAIEANYPVFETTVPSLTSLPYPTSALPLEVGTRYAWRVRSLAPSSGGYEDVIGGGVPLGENQGLSEVFTFTRTATIVLVPGLISLPRPSPPPVVAHSPFFNRLVHGRLEYAFDPGVVPTPTRVPLAVPLPPVFPLLGQPSGGQAPMAPLPTRPMIQQEPARGDRVGEPGPWPLAGVTVRLVVRYRTRDDWVLLGPVHAGGRTFDDLGRIVATATTDDQGRFTFAFQDEEPTGVIADAGTPIVAGPGDVSRTYDGPLARFYQIEVADPRYLSPSDEIVVGEHDTGDLGTLVSLVRKYRLRLHVIDRETGSPPAAGEYAITVNRADPPPTVPEMEGEGPRAVLGPYRRVTRKVGAEAGSVTLWRLVRNVGPADRYRLSFSVPEGSEAHYRLARMDYANSWPRAGATFNEDYDLSLVAVDTLRVVPLPPRYIGTLVDATTDEPIDRALLLLTDRRGRSQASPRRVVPSDNGRFVWDIPAPRGAQEEWTIHALALGYESVRVGAPTRRGFRREQVIAMRPAGVVRGQVEDQQGAPVTADVWYGDREDVAVAETRLAITASGQPGQGVTVGEVVNRFSFRAQAPSSDTLHVAPTEDRYCPVAVPTRLRAGENDLGTITVPRKDRRVAVRVVAGEPGGLGGLMELTLAGVEQEPIEGAIVEALDVYHEDGVTLRADTTDTDGRAFLRLGFGAERVRVRARGPGDGEYETRSAPATTTACGDPDEVTIQLPPASRIAGTVYQGPGSDVPVEGARVLVVGRSEFQATTDARGRYEIRGVPRLQFTIRAGGLNTGGVAEDRELNVSEAVHDDFDFHLGGAAQDALDWSDGLLGFPVMLTEDPEPVGDGFAITGLVYMPPNPAFAHPSGTSDTIRVPFDSVVVRPDAQRRPSPVGDQVRLGATRLELRLLQQYTVLQADQDGLALRARTGGTGGTGALFGPVSLVEPFLGVAFEDAAGRPGQPLLIGPGQPIDGGIATLTADAVSPGDTYGLAGADGGDLRFRISGFPADAPSDATTLDSDGLRLDATLHTDIPGIDDLALPATGLRVLAGPDGGPEPLAVDRPLERSLQQWTLRADGWSLSRGRAYLTGGELVVPMDTATGAGMNLPLSGVRLLPDAFQSAAFRDAPLSLGGIVDLSVNARDLTFNRDGETGPWRIYASTGVSIPALPGMRPTDRIPLGYLRLRSDGDVALTPESGTVVRLFDAADFHVSSVVPGETGLSIGGALDAGIPNVGPLTHSIRYRPGQSGLEFGMAPLDIGPVAIGGARLYVEDAALDSTGLHGGGYVEVPDRFRVATRFRRTPPGRGDIIEAVPEPDATIDVGEIAIDGIEGGARFLEAGWETRFDGDLDVDGEIGGRLSFAVEGSDVNIGTGGLDVRNIETPFGDLTITINFPLERVEGSMDIDGYIADGLYGNGRAQMVMSGAPGNRYWYVYAGMGFLLDSPHLEGSAAFIVGNTTLSGQLLADFNSYSVHGVPPSFYRVRGFFLEGQVSWPLPICPSGGFDIGVAQVGVWCNVRGDLRMGMNFLEANTYHIGGLVGLNVGASGQYGLGMCVSLWGEADAQADLEGAYRSDGAWYILGRADVNLNGGASYGVGVDDVCLDYTKSFTIGLGAAAQLGHNWNTGEGRFVRVFYR